MWNLGKLQVFPAGFLSSRAQLELELSVFLGSYSAVVERAAKPKGLNHRVGLPSNQPRILGSGGFSRVLLRHRRIARVVVGRADIQQSALHISVFHAHWN